jgi:hypothetical protein
MPGYRNDSNPEEKYKQIERYQKRMLNLPRRKELIQHLREMYEQLPKDEKPELRIQYLGALATIEDPRATVTGIKDAVKMVGELIGLYRQQIDITAKRDKDEYSEADLAELIASSPPEVRKLLGKAAKEEEDA